MSQKKSIIVTVDDEALKDMKGVVDKLTAKGMSVDNVLHKTGVISGSCSPDAMSGLRGVSGVSGVEEDIGVQLPPPDSPIQ